DGNHDQADQCRHAAAGQHPVIDLQHEDRAGQIQEVDDAAHQPDANERAAARPQRITEFGTPDAGNGCHQSILIQGQTAARTPIRRGFRADTTRSYRVWLKPSNAPKINLNGGAEFAQDGAKGPRPTAPRYQSHVIIVTWVIRSEFSA